jgi:hypothetical protein
LNYLQLCQDLAREAGTGAFPGTVVGLNGRPLKIAGWVRQAWIEIQNDRDEWRWLQDNFEGTVLAGVDAYEASDFGLTRFSNWKPGRNPKTGVHKFTIQAASASRATEAGIEYVPLDLFSESYQRGANAGRVGSPIAYTVDDRDRLVFWPTPDASYVVRGLYRKSAQQLLNSDDVPEIHESHHKIIVWKGLLLMSPSDETYDQPRFWGTSYTDMLGDLQRKELPPIRFGRPLS